MRKIALLSILVASIGCKSRKSDSEQFSLASENSSAEQITEELSAAKTVLAQSEENGAQGAQLTEQETSGKRASPEDIVKLKNRIAELQAKLDALGGGPGDATDRVSLQVTSAKLIMWQNPGALWGYDMPLSIDINRTYVNRSTMRKARYKIETTSWPKLILEAGKAPSVVASGRENDFGEVSTSKAILPVLWNKSGCFQFTGVLQGFGVLDVVDFEKYVCRHDFTQASPNDPKMFRFKMVSDVVGAFYDPFGPTTSKGSTIEVEVVLNPKL